MGKYSKDNPRNNVISMRINDEERAIFSRIASQNHLSISDLMRRAMEVFTNSHSDIGIGQRAA